MTENVKHVEVLQRVRAALPVLRTILTQHRLHQGAIIAGEHLEELDAVIAALQREAAGDGEGVPYWVNALPAPIGNPQDWPENFANGFNEALRRVDEALPAKWRLDAPRPTGTDGGTDAEAAKRYIRDWCPDHVKDYIASLTTPASAEPGEGATLLRTMLELGCSQKAQTHVCTLLGVPLKQVHPRDVERAVAYFSDKHHEARGGGEEG